MLPEASNSEPFAATIWVINAAGAVPVAVNVTWDVLAVPTEVKASVAGLKLAVTLLGRFVALSVTVPVDPPRTVTVVAKVMVEFASRVSEVGADTFEPKFRTLRV